MTNSDVDGLQSTDTNIAFGEVGVRVDQDFELAGIPLRQLAASMGHDVRTHMKHYGQWTDEAGLDAAFGAANAKLTASLTKRHQQMQQQQ